MVEDNNSTHGRGEANDAAPGKSSLQELLTSEEAAAILKIDAKTVERMARLREIPGFKLGKFWRYRASDLESWIETKSRNVRQP